MKVNTNKITRNIIGNWQLYLMLLLPVVYIIVFWYVPMYGAQIAFKKFNPRLGILGSEWVGLKYFIKFFNSPYFGVTMKNTILVSLYDLAVTFPLSIGLALSLNYVMNLKFKKTVQMITYAPFFVSEVVVVGIILQMLAQRGIVNNIIRFFGFEAISFLGNPDFFRDIYVWSSAWQMVGFGSIIYIAALAGVSPSLHEAASIDGATKLKRIWHIDLPSILPTITIMFILRVGMIMNVSFQKALLLQNDLNISASEILWTYTYRIGFSSGLPQFSYASAIGLVANIINFSMLLIVNQVSKRYNGNGLF